MKIEVPTVNSTTAVTMTELGSSPPGERLQYRILSILLGLAFLVCSTVALAHAHSDLKPDESHCPICMVAHIVGHVVWCPPAIAQVTLVQSAREIVVPPVLVSSLRLTSTLGRAPPVAP
jgi:hypothetical protein